MTQPPRPARYQSPKLITLLPVKQFMRKPYWSLVIDGVPCKVKNKAEAFDVIRRRFAQIFFTDEQIWAELSNLCGDILRWPHSYNFNAEKGIFVEFRDQHNWHREDEVLYVFWLSKQRKAAA